MTNKVVPIHNIPAAGMRCHVNILDLYFSKLPLEAYEHDSFYYQSLSTISDDSSAPWFSANPVKRNTLGKMVKEICSEGKITVRKTNQSLQATGA